MSTADDAARRSGPGRVLIAVYAVFAVSASARALYQVLTDWPAARLAYGLSALAAAIYLLATFALVKPGWWRVAVTAVGIELAGVLLIGALSFARPELFPRASVWSHFGQGYGYVPAVLPVAGLWWLMRTRPGRPVPE